MTLTVSFQDTINVCCGGHNKICIAHVTTDLLHTFDLSRTRAGKRLKRVFVNHRRTRNMISIR